MQQNIDKALLMKYLENKCSAEELKQVVHYLANTEYPETLDQLLEEEWLKYKAPDADNDQLAKDLLSKFKKRIDPQ